MNSGDWVEHMTALEYENKSWRLFQYDANDFPSFKQHRNPKQVLNVVTDDIMVHFSRVITQHVMPKHPSFSNRVH